MKTTTQIYSAEEVLTSLGYPDPLVAARQHARMILLGRLARYQSSVQQFEAQWECTLDDLRTRYKSEGGENFKADEDYLEWQWYTDAIQIVEAQLAALTES